MAEAAAPRSPGATGARGHALSQPTERRLSLARGIEARVWEKGDGEAAPLGFLGGLRGLVHVRQILTNLGVHVVPAQVAVSQAHSALGEQGLNDERQASFLEKLVGQLVETTSKLKA